MSVCEYCYKDPCMWDTVSATVLESIRKKQQESNYAHNELRKIGYKTAVNKIHGVLGRGNRVQLPQCVVNGVRNEYPDCDGYYMGYKEC